MNAEKAGCSLLISASDIRLLEEILRGGSPKQRPKNLGLDLFFRSAGPSVDALISTTSTSLARPSYFLPLPTKNGKLLAESFM
jgi:hypothetical protein